MESRHTAAPADSFVVGALRGARAQAGSWGGRIVGWSLWGVGWSLNHVGIQKQISLLFICSSDLERFALRLGLTNPSEAQT